MQDYKIKIAAEPIVAAEQKRILTLSMLRSWLQWQYVGLFLVEKLF